MVSVCESLLFKFLNNRSSLSKLTITISLIKSLMMIRELINGVGKKMMSPLDHQEA